jgi:hypothetical protein
MGSLLYTTATGGKEVFTLKALNVTPWTRSKNDPPYRGESLHAYNTQGRQYALEKVLDYNVTTAVKKNKKKISAGNLQLAKIKNKRSKFQKPF